MRSPWSIAALLVGAFVFAFGGYFVADSVTGPSAVVGNPGAQGPAGADGADGRDGHDGVDGLDGTDGRDGAPGPRGIPGATGATGATGAVGATGADGAPGPEGAPGIQGPAGADGEAGAQGPAGSQGADGPRSFGVHEQPGSRTLSSADPSWTIASLTLPAGTWAVNASWSGATTNSVEFACLISGTGQGMLINGVPAPQVLSVTQVWTIPIQTTVEFRCLGQGPPMTLTFEHVNFSAVEITN